MVKLPQDLPWRHFIPSIFDAGVSNTKAVQGVNDKMNAIILAVAVLAPDQIATHERLL